MSGILRDCDYKCYEVCLYEYRQGRVTVEELQTAWRSTADNEGHILSVYKWSKTCI